MALTTYRMTKSAETGWCIYRTEDGIISVVRFGTTPATAWVAETEPVEIGGSLPEEILLQRLPDQIPADLAAEFARIMAA